ncbi:unnamed protein product, partial [Rotaria sordida]
MEFLPDALIGDNVTDAKPMAIT